MAIKLLRSTLERVAVNINNPANNASVTSPVNIVANGSSAKDNTGWQIYVDGISSFGQNCGNSVDAELSMSSGTHTVLVRAWDSTGGFGDPTIKVTVP